MLDRVTKTVKNAVFLWVTFWATLSSSVTYLNSAHDFITHNPLEVISVVLVSLMFMTAHFVHKRDQRKLQCQHDRLHSVLNEIQTNTANVSSKVLDLSTKVEDLSAMQLHMRIKLIQAEIDKQFRTLQHKEHLTEDEAKYLIELDACRKELGVNSFTERKISFLLAKDIEV